MKLPFIKNDGKTKEERELNSKIQQEAWSITKRAMLRQLKGKDIDKLERMYATYFKKFPDINREISSKDRIKKLREFIK